MALKLERRTNSHQLLKLVAVADDAIDWALTYGPDGGSEADRRKRYEKSHDVRDLVFKDGTTPTVFVFEHPARVDVDRKVRRFWTDMLKPGSKADLWTDVWNELYLGKEEGLVDAPREEPPRQGGNLTESFLQLLVDADVFDELGQAVLDEARRKAETRAAAADTKKK